MRLVDLIAQAPWREAVTYRDTWPHEYVLVKRDGQQALLDAVCARLSDGEGVAGRFFTRSTPYLFVGEHKYWTETPCADMASLPAQEEIVLNRALLYRDRRDFHVRQGDTGARDAEATDELAARERGAAC